MKEPKRVGTRRLKQVAHNCRNACSRLGINAATPVRSDKECTHTRVLYGKTTVMLPSGSTQHRSPRSGTCALTPGLRAQENITHEVNELVTDAWARIRCRTRPCAGYRTVLRESSLPDPNSGVPFKQHLDTIDCRIRRGMRRDQYPLPDTPEVIFGAPLPQTSQDAHAKNTRERPPGNTLLKILHHIPQVPPTSTK